MIKFRTVHNDDHVTDKFVWLNPAHIVAVRERPRTVTRWKNGKTESVESTVTEVNVVGSASIQVHETPEDIADRLTPPVNIG